MGDARIGLVEWATRKFPWVWEGFIAGALQQENGRVFGLGVAEDGCANDPALGAGQVLKAGLEALVIHEGGIDWHGELTRDSEQAGEMRRTRWFYPSDILTLYSCPVDPCRDMFVQMPDRQITVSIGRTLHCHVP